MSRELQTRHFDALGSTCELLSLGSGQGALERCEAWVRDAEARFTRFLPDSELAGLNAGGGRYVPVSPELFAMLEAALWAFEESEGLVNAAVLPALIAAGYDRPFRQGLTEPAFVNPLPLPSLPEVLILDQATRSAALAPAAALDLGGIVKGALATSLLMSSVTMGSATWAATSGSAVPDRKATGGTSASATARWSRSRTGRSAPAALPGGAGATPCIT